MDSIRHIGCHCRPLPQRPKTDRAERVATATKTLHACAASTATCTELSSARMHAGVAGASGTRCRHQRQRRPWHATGVLHLLVQSEVVAVRSAEA